jgi:2-dehydro-3-deoxygluconokinase
MNSSPSLLTIKPAASDRYDLVSLGEVMLRLDPGESRVRCAREFTAWEGGGEYNVARGLRRCFGLQTAICTAFADNEVGRLLEGCILQGGVDTRYVLWRPFDGVGRQIRNGLNFTERGFGVRGAAGMYDRGHSAASQLKPGDFDWDAIFGRPGARWFHTGGIFAALSDTTLILALEAVKAAQRHGVIVSYDLNYRPSLWQNIGGQARAREVNTEIARHVDVMIGNTEHLKTCLGIEPDGMDSSTPESESPAFEAASEAAARAYPNFKVVATTLRATKTATRNDWGALCWMGGQFYRSRPYLDLEIFDRIGGGDGFASGFIFGLITGAGPQLAVDYGAAHGALAMTTPGDNSMASKAEIEALMRGEGIRAQR